MIGFDGDAILGAALRASLVGLLEVFPQHLAKPRPPTWFDPAVTIRNDQFDALLRAHKKDRLAIPIQALRATGAPYHNFILIHPRRLAWFVPSLLASWLGRAPGRTPEIGAGDLESMARDATIIDEDWEWTDEEAAALAGFFDSALAAALATELARESPTSNDPSRTACACGRCTRRRCHSTCYASQRRCACRSIRLS
jgi:hypothetical protein